MFVTQLGYRVHKSCHQLKPSTKKADSAKKPAKNVQESTSVKREQPVRKPTKKPPAKKPKVTLSTFVDVNKVDEWNEFPPVQSSVDSSQYVEVPSVTSLPREDQASLEFRLDKSDTAGDIGSMLMYTTLQVLKRDGSKLIETDQVATVNLMACSMFESVEVFISDQTVNQASSNYPWMCYILNILNETKEAKKTVLKAAGWEADKPNMFDRVGIDAAGISNKGWVERAAMV